jgi:hypothetical protein
VFESGDWIGVFNNDVCVGSKYQCEDGCGIEVMGVDGTGSTDGYMNSGDIPTFKIYDLSAGTSYALEYEGSIDGWEANITINVEVYAENISLGCTDSDACNFESVENSQCKDNLEDCFDDGSCYYGDCTNDCDGDATEDCWGVCGGPSILGCDNVCNSQAIIDHCGDCTGGTTNQVECVQDCAGIWGGYFEFDECDICGGDNACAGCDGIADSGLVNDACGVCGGDDSPNTGVCDCAGIPNGIAEYDVCGVCDGEGEIYACGCNDDDGNSIMACDIEGCDSDIPEYHRP